MKGKAAAKIGMDCEHLLTELALDVGEKDEKPLVGKKSP
jgi:hypothetical protein